MRHSYSGSSFSPAISDIPALATRVGRVIDAVAPDVVTIQEGAGLPEMKHFFDQFVSGDDWKLLRGSGAAQALVVAARTDGDVEAIHPGSDVMGAVDLNQAMEADVDADLVINDIDFARKPQVVKLRAHGQCFWLLNNHLKSKYVNEGEDMYDAGGNQRLEFYKEALKARRRISAEAFRIRKFLDAILEDDAAALIVVTGDLNDGAGTDFFEEHFLTHSVVDRVFGSVFWPARQLTHVLFHGGSTDYTAVFDDFIAGETRELVLDHIGISKAISDNWNWRGRVAVAEYGAQVIDNPNLHKRDLKPSDHRPVVADMAPD
jgi:hypothetical protein